MCEISNNFTHPHFGTCAAAREGMRTPAVCKIDFFSRCIFSHEIKVNKGLQGDPTVLPVCLTSLKKSRLSKSICL